MTRDTFSVDATGWYNTANIAWPLSGTHVIAFLGNIEIHELDTGKSMPCISVCTESSYWFARISNYDYTNTARFIFQIEVLRLCYI